ncbi:MAG: GDSL-type esterase/lipase family protein [Pseudomonadota bacterium]
MTGVDLALRARAAIDRRDTVRRLDALRLLARFHESRGAEDAAGGGDAVAIVTPRAFADPSPGLTRSLNWQQVPAAFAYSGGKSTYVADSNGFLAPTVRMRSGGNLLDGQYNAIAPRFSFLTDAPSMDVILASARYRVLVDGCYVTPSVREDGLVAGGFNRLNIALADATRRLRRIDVELDRNGVIGGAVATYLDTLWIGPADRVAAIGDVQALRIAVLGDSVASSTGASWSHLGFAPRLGRILGGVAVDVRQLAIGATGYVADGTRAGEVQQSAMPERVEELSEQGPFDLIVFAAGLNDPGLPGIRGAVRRALARARMLAPFVPILVLGCWAPATGATPALLACEAEIELGVRDVGDTLTAFIPVLGDPAGAWIDAGNGPIVNAANAPGGGAPDGTHPGDIGHEYLARRCAIAIRAAIAAMAHG